MTLAMNHVEIQNGASMASLRDHDSNTDMIMFMDGTTETEPKLLKDGYTVHYSSEFSAETFSQTEKSSSSSKKHNMGQQTLPVTFAIHSGAVSKVCWSSTQTSSIVCYEKDSQTIFSPFSRRTFNDDESNVYNAPGMECFTQTEEEPKLTLPPLRDESNQTDEESSIGLKQEVVEVIESWTQTDAQAEKILTDSESNTELIQEPEMLTVDAEAQYEGGNVQVQDSCTQYEIRWSDSITQSEEFVLNIKALDTTEAFTQYEPLQEFSDAIIQYEKTLSSEAETQYEYLKDEDDSELLKDENDINNNNTIAATIIRDNLVKEESRSSKVSYLRGKMEDCLQNLSWYQSETISLENDEDELDLEFPGFADEVPPPEENNNKTKQRQVMNEQTFDYTQQGDQFAKQEEPLMNDEDIPYTLSMGDTFQISTTSRSKRSKKPVGSHRKFCIVM